MALLEGEEAIAQGADALAKLRARGHEDLRKALASNADAAGAEVATYLRAAHEVTHPLGVAAAPAGVRAFNPAFDVTPAELVSAIVCERAVVRAPDEARLRALLAPPP